MPLVLIPRVFLRSHRCHRHMPSRTCLIHCRRCPRCYARSVVIPSLVGQARTFVNLAPLELSSAFRRMICISLFKRLRRAKCCQAVPVPPRQPACGIHRGAWLVPLAHHVQSVLQPTRAALASACCFQLLTCFVLPARYSTMQPQGNRSSISLHPLGRFRQRPHPGHQRGGPRRGQS